jgi:hypothetical protein
VASLPPITGIRLIEVPAPSGNSAYGHLAWDISLQGGENLVLEAGPSGPNGTGNLVQQDYGTTATSSNSISLPGTFNLQAVGGDAPVLVSGTPGDGNPDPGSGGGTPVRLG